MGAISTTQQHLTGLAPFCVVSADDLSSSPGTAHAPILAPLILAPLILSPTFLLAIQMTVLYLYRTSPESVKRLAFWIVGVVDPIDQKWLCVGVGFDLGAAVAPLTLLIAAVSDTDTECECDDSVCVWVSVWVWVLLPPVSPICPGEVVAMICLLLKSGSPPVPSQICQSSSSSEGAPVYAMMTPSGVAPVPVFWIASSFEYDGRLETEPRSSLFVDTVEVVLESKVTLWWASSNTSTNENPVVAAFSETLAFPDLVDAWL